MGRLKRWWNRMRNYTSGGDYPGGYGNGSGGSPSRESANMEAVNRSRDTGPLS